MSLGVVLRQVSCSLYPMPEVNLAETYKQTQKVAQQWQNYVSGEKANYELLREAVESD